MFVLALLMSFAEFMHRNMEEAQERNDGRAMVRPLKDLARRSNLGWGEFWYQPS